jgi:hypothetical protein
MELRRFPPVESTGAFLGRTGTMGDVSRPDSFERSDADPRLISAIAVGVALFLIAVPLFVLAVYRDAPRLGRIPENLPRPPAPQLQVRPQDDLKRLRAEESARLDSFGWADSDRENVRIPIERAMKLLAERGIAGWPSPPGSRSAHAPP